MKKAFAIMPFGGIEDQVYDNFIKPIFLENEIKIKRADESKNSKNIVTELIQYIDDSDIILADITQHNANVYYELAVAHALNKPTIMITRDIDNMPFDLKQWRSIVYNNGAEGLMYLSSQIKAILSLFNIGRFEYSSPVVDSLTNTPFSSVLRTAEIVLLESKAKRLVCVLAPDIEIGPSEFKDVMKENIEKRQIEYRYMIPDVNEIISDYSNFVADLDLGEFSHYLKAKKIDFQYIESDLTIIDPKTKNESAFILAPPEQPEFHFRIVGSNLVRLKNRFNNLWFEGEEILKDAF